MITDVMFHSLRSRSQLIPVEELIGDCAGSSLLLLNTGCTLRVVSQVLAYERYWTPAWNVLPWSAICELAAVAVFAANLLLTFKQPPAHEMIKATAA